MEPRLKWKK